MEGRAHGTQVAMVINGQVNNINKVPGEVNTLLRNVAYYVLDHLS